MMIGVYGCCAVSLSKTLKLAIVLVSYPGSGGLGPHLKLFLFALSLPCLEKLGR